MKGADDPPPLGDPNHTQAMHYRRNQRWDRPGDTYAEEWDSVEEDTGEGVGGGGGVGLFLQIVLLQTLAG